MVLPIKKLGISITQAKSLSLKDKKMMDDFYRKHWLKGIGHEELTIILKTHLYVESLMDEILLYILPNPRKIINYRFSTKVEILEALNIAPSKLIIEKLKEVNKIRNRFSHELNKSLTSSELANLIKGLKIKQQSSSFAKLKSGLMYIVGYLHALKTIYKLFPFVLFCVSHNGIFKKDKGYQIAKIKKVYPWKEVSKVIEGMKL